MGESAGAGGLTNVLPSDVVGAFSWAIKLDDATASRIPKKILFKHCVIFLIRLLAADLIIRWFLVSFFQ
jgi:hypothetical protein